ncbi:hypothetical protein [Desulfatibacillum aliphaticivorans]|uniref:hypothetical protein n=1 Tax=Desulfatibacillum aliphaticivorans TaxID=218208 RepID=UPI00041B9E51|nr:hypothetical protein [Desulfatibacillum aliphaticivorans]
MPKVRKKTDAKGPQQMALDFDYRQVEAVAAKVRALKSAPSTEGTANVREKLRISIKHALKQCPLSRVQVAGEMSHLLGDVEISRYMLDTWTAESKEGHRFPAEYLPAFCRVTDNTEPLELLAEASGCFAMPGQDALRAQMQKIEEEIKRLSSQKRTMSVLIKTAGGE